jgi:uncharacterized heparinase superfamily protein
MIPWHLRRLARMQPREVVSRIRTAARLPRDWVRYCTGGSPTIPVELHSIPQPFPVHAHASGAAVDCLRIFDLDFPVSFDFDWHRDYRNDKQAPRTFGPMLNTRNPAAVGDIKYIWEINRHQYLSALAYAGGSEQSVPYIVRSLDRWLRENPYLCGVNWTSSLELGLRVISWSLLYSRIACELVRDTDLMQRWLNSLYLHLKRIRQHRSVYSSANNHLIGELVGLYVGSVCFPLWRESRGWAVEARESLEREIQAQVSEDGINREQAMSYHLFTLELLLLAYTVAKNVGEPFSKNYGQRLRAMLRYLDAVATPTGDLPWYGDYDDGRGFVFSTSESALAVTTQLGALLFDDARLLRFSKGLTAATRALVPNATLAFTEGRRAGRELFRDGGMAAVDTLDGSRKLVMDFGPLGYTSIAAHGHADALSIWLAIDDDYFIVDCGTYAYHSDPVWRTFFRGTAAHNTARVDGKDQSVMGGRFLWTCKANARLLRFEETGNSVLIVAEHDGYTRLADPVVHRRSVSFNRNTGALAISDNFQCKGRHEVEIFFHLHEDTRINRIETGTADTTWRGRHIVFGSPDRGLKWEVVRGGDRPILGWRSHCFGQKQPIPTLRIVGSLHGPTTIHTNIQIQD